MAHLQMNEFIMRVKNRFPDYFKNVNVLDLGSLDINGNNRIFFDDMITYTGVDLGEGKNVNVVCLAHEYKTDNIKFDVVITTELLEHDIFWRQTFLNGFDLLKSNGMYIFTCAGYGRFEHGTKRSEGWTSPFTSNMDIWGNYYENRTTRDFINLLDFEKEFNIYSFEYGLSLNNIEHDLYFFGIKR